MIIERVELTPTLMRKEDPTWRFALGASPSVEGFVVTLTGDDGTKGYGYTGATPHMGAFPGGLKAALERFSPLVTGRDAFAREETMALLDSNLAGHVQAKAAIDCAMHDLAARALNIPLHQLFGGKMRDSLPILRILAIKSPEDMAKQAEKLVKAGYKYLKVKVYGEVAEDVARVRAIRERVGAGIHLTIDANQSYTVKNAVNALNRMAEFDIDLVEQPVAADDLKGLKHVTDSVPVTVEADESAGSLNEVMFLVSNRIVDAVSLKIPKLGGLRNTLAAARICEVGHVKYRLGAAVGSRLLSAQGVHLGASLPGCDYACELGEFDRLMDDPFSGIEIENGELRVPPGAASGVVLRAHEKAA